MLTTLIDLLSTGSAIGLVLSVSALGMAVLPWRAAEVRTTTGALDAMVRMPFGWAQAATPMGPRGATPVPMAR